MIKLVVTDLDGTLLNDEMRLAPDFFEVLEEMKKRGVIFTAASGRSQYTIEKIFEPMEKDVLYISDNGGYIKGSVNGEAFEEVNFPLTKSQSDGIIEACLKVGNLNIIMSAKDKAYFINPMESCLDIIKLYYINYEIIEDFRSITDEILKIAVYDPMGSAVHGYPRIKDKLDEELIGVVSADHWFDVMNKNVNKGEAVEEIQKRFSITPDETMVFGDFYNDIEMLKKAKYSFAMQNSNEAVKKHSNFIAQSNNDFGVTKAIKEHCLVRA